MKKKIIALLLTIVVFYPNIVKAEELTPPIGGSVTPIPTPTPPSTLSSDSTLSNLIVVGRSFKETFSPTKKIYNLKVNSGVSSITIEATPNDANAKIKGVTGAYRVTHSLTQSIETFNIEVEAEDNTKTVYKINVEKEEESLPTLKSLKVLGHSLNEIFSKDRLTYTLDVEYDINTLKIEALSTNNGRIEITGNEKLEVGRNYISILVYNKEGTKSEKYSIVVSRKEEEKTELIDSIEEKTENNVSSAVKEVPKNNKVKNHFFKYLMVTFATIILFLIGGFGIYFYITTKEKKNKKGKKQVKEKEIPVVKIAEESNIVNSENNQGEVVRKRRSRSDIEEL